MNNIDDYLKWRGDLSFEQDPLNEADALLFACISYVDFEGIVPEHGYVTLKEASRIFHEIHTEEELESDRSFLKFAPGLLKRASETRRFANIELSSYVNIIDQENLIQFSAVTIRILPDEVFIAFRGTDDTIVGWKEDFYLSYTKVYSEELAVDYLIGAQQGRRDKIMMGGHSKGGHLAIFAAYSVEPDIEKRIKAIYDLDGPGFNDAIIRSARFKKIGPRIRRFIPENSVIGRLLSDTTKPVIVASSEKGIMQHDPVSWGIEGNHLVTLPKTSVASDVLDETLTKWINEMGPEEKRQFTDDLFAVIEASGETNISMLSKCKLSGVKAMLDQMHTLKRGSQDKIRVLLRLFIDNWGEIIIDIAMATRGEAMPKLPLRKFLVAKKKNQEGLEGGST